MFRGITPFQILSLVVSTGLVSVTFGFWYNNMYNVPNLEVQLSFGRQESPDKCMWATIIQNTGHQAATNVRVTIVIEGVISNYTFFVPEEVRVDQTASTLLFRMPRLATGASLTLSILSSHAQSPIDMPVMSIWVTADQGSTRLQRIAAGQIERTDFLQASWQMYQINLTITAVTVSITTLFLSWQVRRKGGQ